jgi:hypothetical protein
MDFAGRALKAAESGNRCKLLYYEAGFDFRQKSDLLIV